MQPVSNGTGALFWQLEVIDCSCGWGVLLCNPHDGHRYLYRNLITQIMKDMFIVAISNAALHVAPGKLVPKVEKEERK